MTCYTRGYYAQENAHAGKNGSMQIAEGKKQYFLNSKKDRDFYSEHRTFGKHLMSSLL